MHCCPWEHHLCSTAFNFIYVCVCIDICARCTMWWERATATARQEDMVFYGMLKSSNMYSGDPCSLGITAADMLACFAQSFVAHPRVAALLLCLCCVCALHSCPFCAFGRPFPSKGVVHPGDKRACSLSLLEFLSPELLSAAHICAGKSQAESHSPNSQACKPTPMAEEAVVFGLLVINILKYLFWKASDFFMTLSHQRLSTQLVLAAVRHLKSSMCFSALINQGIAETNLKTKNIHRV